MAIEQLDEYEQGEQVRKWLRQNGSSIITGIALGLACIFLWNWWQGQGSRHREEAATQYVSFTDAIAAKDNSKIDALAAAFDSKYADTGFSALATLRNAQYLQSNGQTAKAIALLHAKAGKIKDPIMSELFVLHEGRLLLIAGKPDDALKRIAGIQNSNFPEVLGELRGDIQMAKGQRDEARKSYEQALTHLDQAAPTRGLLELKLIDAGGQPPAQPEA
jgi:predicted negative regulator of RcsB-dependent stress response